MPEHHPAAEYVKLFPSDDIPKIVQDVICMCAGLKRQTPSELENKLSARLYKKLLYLPAYRIGPLRVVPLWESPIVNSTENEMEITGRADILFLFPGGGMETYFLVEAKRLFVPTVGGKIASLVGKYIDDGMMRFVKGQYASKMVAGAMLGYVFDKPVGDAKSALCLAISKKNAKLKMTSNMKWRQSSLSVTPPVDETQHLLVQGEFTIYHILTEV